MANNYDESKIVPSLFSCGKQLSAEWKAIATKDQRIYFVNRRTRSSHWFPPPEFWASKHGLPYGWEAALDEQSKKYYINHVTRTTTREDPRSEADQATHQHMTPPQARRIELVRDAKIGFGFVAGSEKPVVIRSVILNGPSYDKLFANDQILKVNGKDVTDAAQADVISLIKSAVGRIELEVVASEDVQDTNNQHNRKSSLMSRATRERRRSTPVSVRFADEPALVQVLSPMEPVRRSSVPLIPNVLKVFLENGQTRSFRYDSNTTAEEIFSSFSSKLDVKLMEHFSLVLSGPKKGQISYIQNNEKISEIYANRNCSSVNCLCKLNIAFVPKDHFELLSQDRNTFEYLYAQVTNRVVEGFYGMDLKYDLAIKLAALQIQQKAMETAAGRPVKISVRQVEKEFGGLGKFVASDLLHNMKEKELRKILDQQIKQNENLASPGERYMSSLQCKLHYLNLAAEMFSYGGRYFDAQLLDNGSGEGPSLKKTRKQHVTMLVNLKYGVSQVVRGKVNVLCQLAEFHEITGFAIRLQENNRRLLRIKLQEGKKIQLICTTLDCLDIIALITGYYKVYVDNTTNTPLPVENEEKWPFAFLRDSPDSDAVPDFYSKHRVVPDVWSYPSHFQASSANRKSQGEICKPLHKDVFIDLSRAPPRFNETAISEEPEEDNMVVEKSNRNQTDETTSRRDSLRHEDLPQQQDSQYGIEAGVSHKEQDDNSAFVLSDEEQELLETASSFLKNNSGDSNSLDDEMQSDTLNDSETDADSEELFASRKRRRVSSGSSGKESLTIKSAKTVLNENVEEDHEDLISELILAEAIWQEEEAGVILVDERKEHVEEKSTLSSSPTLETDSWEAVGLDSEEPNTCDEVDGTVNEQKQLDVVMVKPGHSQSEGMVNDIVTSEAASNDLFAALYSGTTDENQNILINSCIAKTAPLAEDSEYTTPAASGTGVNLHLDLSVQHDPFISSDPFQDRSPTPSPWDLGFNESKFDNKGIELADFVENGALSQGSVEEESGLEGEGSDGERSDSPAAVSNSDDFTLTSDSRSVKDDICGDTKTDGLDNCDDGVASHMVSLEFDEDSDTETESAMSDEGESLWSTFPEYFQPSRRLRYSSNKEAELSLAEEDQDIDGLDSTETERDVALVSIKGLSTKYESNLMDTVDANERQDGVSQADDWEELSTASSESFECTYEVNAELPSESEEMSEDSGYVNFKEKNERGMEEICDQRENNNSFQPHISMVSPNTSESDKWNTSVDTLSITNDTKSDRTTELCATKTMSPMDQYGEVDFSEKNKFAEMKEGILFKELRSFKDSEDKGRIQDRCYSPSDWIIPPPPSPTPELQEADIRIVSPPPLSPTPVENELDDELKHLIVPPPPSSVDTMPIASGIRIVSPPPLDDTDNGLDHLLYDYDDIRFLSLTDDHKLAKSNVLVSARSFDWNFTEDKKIQAQKAKTASFMSKEDENANKSIVLSSTENTIFNSTTNSCKTSQTPVKHSSTPYALEPRSPDSKSSLPNPSTSCSFNLGDSCTPSKRFHREKRVSEDSPNKMVVNFPRLDNFADIRGKSENLTKAASLDSLSNTTQSNTSVESRTKIPLKPKPPVPPKPRIFRAATDEGKVLSPGKSLAKQMDRSVNSSIVKVPRSVDLVSSNNTKETSCERREALHQAPLSANKQEVLHASCPDTLVVDSSTTTEDIPYRNKANLPSEIHGTKRRLSFTSRSPYVPAPYLSSPTHTSTPHTNSLSSAGSPTINSAVSPPASRSEPYSAGNEPSFNRQQPPLMTYPSSHLSLREANSELGSNTSADGTNCAFPKPPRESLIVQLSTVELQKDTPSPISDSPPPPLPDSSPPKIFPGLDFDGFDFGEPLSEGFQDNIQGDSHEPATFDLPSRAKDLKSKRFSASFDNKLEASSSNFTAKREKIYGGNTLSRSQTLTSFPRDENQSSSSVDWASRRDAPFSDSRTKRLRFPFDESLNLDVTATSSLNSLEECQPNSFKAGCSNVCEEGLSKVSVLKKRLDVYLNGDVSKPQHFKEAKNWPLIFQNNARFLACDIKVISSSVKRGSPQVISAVRTSLDSLEKLVESCEKTYLMLNEKSNHNGRSLVVMVNEVLDKYCDIISTVKTAGNQQPDSPDAEVLVKKTNAMATLIASLIRALRKY
ncbi:hypothetical protein ACROYT_G020099 [Oculina patagonica]